MTKPRKYNTTTLEAITERVAQGKNFVAIADELGVGVNQLRSACCLFGIKSPHGCGTSRTKVVAAEIGAARAKRKAEKDATIAEHIASGKPLRALAVKLGIGISSACQAVKRHQERRACV